jgi:hypothetical protein
MVGVFLQFLSTKLNCWCLSALVRPVRKYSSKIRRVVRIWNTAHGHMACLSIVLAWQVLPENGKLKHDQTHFPSPCGKLKIWKWKVEAVEAWPNAFPLRTSEARSSPWESGEKRISNLCTTPRVEMPPCARNKHTKCSKKGNTSLYFNILQSSMNINELRKNLPPRKSPLENVLRYSVDFCHDAACLHIAET